MRKLEVRGVLRMGVREAQHGWMELGSRMIAPLVRNLIFGMEIWGHFVVRSFGRELW
jgi:hypothetical protein